MRKRNFIITLKDKQERLAQAKSIQQKATFQDFTLIHAKDDEDLSSMLQELKPSNFIAVLDMILTSYTTLKRLELEFNAIVLHGPIEFKSNIFNAQGEHVSDSNNPCNYV